jgi:tetratricopeptide (TPR) repeat protein
MLTVLITIGCSTKKNTSATRRWQAFTANYNTYYNATLAYIDGSLEKEENNSDNFTETIPLYTVGNKGSKEIGKGNFEKAIEKCEKAIQLHSIKRRPEWPPGKRKTDKDREWLARKEYNPFLWKAWLLMGRSQFYEGAFEDAASTFSFMSRLYATQPSIYGRARAWLAKCYIEQGWLYDAEDVINQMKHDTIHWQARKEWDYTMTDYYLHSGDYNRAIPYLKKVIKHEMRRKQKAREWYLMGQIEEQLGHKDLAYKAYHNIIKLNPPYQLEFNARIAMTEVVGQTNAMKMIKRLKGMARSDKNKDYLDQVYYAIGNLYLTRRDTASAISAYEKGNVGATRTGIEKGVLLLKLGDLYWNKEKYSDAQRCYGEAIGLLDKERPDYAQLSQRSTVLDELVPFTEAVHLQDSLLVLSTASEKDRNAAIDRTIEALKKKEKEEKERQAEANAQMAAQNGTGGSDLAYNTNTKKNTTTTTNQTTTQSGEWYFYNPMAISQGKSAFQKQWGQRKNEDNWQRSNKTVVAGVNGGNEENGDNNVAESQADTTKAKTDTLQNDPHNREYYLAQIPFTDEQKTASNNIIKDGLFNEGVIFKDKLDNLQLSEKALRRLTDHYPDYEGMDEAYYHLFLLYSREGKFDVADQYIDKLKKQFPQSKWTTVLTNPYFKENAQFGVQLEDSLYAATYDAFRADKSSEVEANTHISEKRFPLGANRDKFVFISGMNRLNNGDTESCLKAMNEVVEKYPQSTLAELAGMIINGVKAGRKLRGAKFDIGNVWQRRTSVMADSDSIKSKKFSIERNTAFTFMIVYQPDSVDQNRLLFELAKYNFTSYLARNFEIEMEQSGDLNRMKISGFANYDEALQYARAIYMQKSLVRAIGSRGRTIIISDDNIPLLGAQFSYDDYDKFYALHFAPLKTAKQNLLEEPSEIVIEKEDGTKDVQPNVSNANDNGGMLIIPEAKGKNENTNVGTVIQPQQPAEKAKTEQQGTVIVPEKQPETKQQGTVVVPEKQPETKQQGTVIVPEKQPETKQGTVIVPEKQPETKQQGTVIVPEKQTEMKQQGTVIVPEKQTEMKQQGTVIVPEKQPETKQQGTVVVPEQPKQTVESGTIIIPEQPKKTVVNEQNNAEQNGTIIIPQETKTTKTVETKKTTNTKAAQKTSTKKKTTTQEPSTVKPAVKSTAKPQQTKQNGTVIYFEDGFGDNTKQSKNSKAQKAKKDEKKKNEFDLEDEYYDLKGF